MERKISLRLDVELADRLQDHADRERVPVSYVLRHLVIRFLSDPIRDTVRSTPSVRAEAAARDTARLQTEFRQEACALFDDFRAQGLDMREATKRTNFALKARNHPWATFEVVASVIRDTGRFRKAKGRLQG